MYFTMIISTVPYIFLLCMCVFSCIQIKLTNSMYMVQGMKI